MTRDQLKKLERDLWAAADKLRANSDLKASEYSTRPNRHVAKSRR